MRNLKAGLPTQTRLDPTGARRVLKVVLLTPSGHINPEFCGCPVYRQFLVKLTHDRRQPSS